MLPTYRESMPLEIVAARVLGRGKAAERESPVAEGAKAPTSMEESIGSVIDRDELPGGIQDRLPHLAAVTLDGLGPELGHGPDYTSRPVQDMMSRKGHSVSIKGVAGCPVG